MARTDSFRQQHNEILKIANQVSGLLIEAQLSKDANQVRALVARLAVQVKFHLGVEDQWLYPELLKSNDDRLKKLATQYMNEMGNIKQNFENYVVRWSPIEAIEKKPGNFVRETQALFGVLSRRIKLENSELYPAFDRAA